jgi:hypothetical protein
MMIPIPRAGILREVRGVDAAKATPDVEDVIITAHITQELLPPPEGAARTNRQPEAGGALVTMGRTLMATAYSTF